MRPWPLRGAFRGLLPGLLLAAVTAGADDAGRTPLEQRIRLTASLLDDAATGQRIAASGHERAQALLIEGRQHQALAEQALAAGDLATARRASDEALRVVSLARRLVPDAPARQAAARARQEQQLAGLERLLAAWTARGDAGVPAEPADGEARQAVTGLLAQARRLADAGRHDDAAPLLASAAQQISAGMTRLPQQRTLDYTNRATTPAEQFNHELAHHDGLIKLLPVAVAQLRPHGDAVALIERYAETSRTLRQQAIGRQQRGDTPQALADLHNAVLYVLRALAAAGVAMPAPVE